ncbi:MAG: HlyD family type I secretion periplasmic adaptor subunit [Rubrivivax sp.]
MSPRGPGEARRAGTNPEEEERRASRWLLGATGLTLAAALAWAATFELDEITRAQGRVIPASREQVVQSLDAGVLSELLVREGDAVQQGQVLLRIDDARAGPVYREAREKALALAALAARLRAEASGEPLVFPTQLRGEREVVERERRAHDTRWQALEEQVRAIGVTLGATEASVRAVQESMGATRRELDMTQPLVRQGVISEVELLRLQRQQADLNRQIAELGRQHAELQAQIVERRNRYRTDASQELTRVESELAQTRESAAARADTLRRTVLRAPMKGIVKNVQLTTVGAVIQPGQSILEIVPVQDEMLVEAYVRPSEVAFLKTGQAATVKLTAYDFNRYGGLSGTIEHLSPDTLKDERNRRPGSLPELEEGYYRILVRIREGDRVRAGMKLEPLPGMTAMVEIRTGSKTVLEYLFRPLQSVSQALRER